MIRSRFLVRLLAIVVLGTTTLSGCSTLDSPTAPASAVETAQVRAPVLGRLDYSSRPLGRLQLLKRVASTTEGLEILNFLLSRDNLLLTKVSADLELSSRYAVAW